MPERDFNQPHLYWFTLYVFIILIYTRKYNTRGLILYNPYIKKHDFSVPRTVLAIHIFVESCRKKNVVDSRRKSISVT
jgi:hypothetical protein